MGFPAAGIAALALAGCSDMMMADDSPAAEQSAATQPSEETVMVGGAPMYPSRNIVENAVNSADHTTLVAAVQAAGLTDTLASPGPFTVFAPTNEAFGELPDGAVDTLLQPENKPALTNVLTYHVVPGRLTATELAAMAAAGGGQARLTTAAGAPLLVTVQDGAVMVRDDQGRVATVTTADVMQSNGVIHVVDTVLLPA
jgi:uncharacterized surface protein with fasciclin (FAS1) repeats